MRQKIALTNDNKHIQSFKSTYDRLFKEFQGNLMAEYALMKEAYIQDYKNNYQININEKEANVYEFVATIDDKK